MKTKKLSSILLLIAFILIGGFSIYKGNLIANSLKEAPKPGRNVWLVGTGGYFIDTLSGPYHHLVSDFTMIELNPKESNQIIVDGYKDAKRYLDIKIDNDTLFLKRLLSDNDTSLVRVNEDYPLLTKVGARDLKSITLEGSGSIDIPIRPFGSDLDGTQRYKPEDWEKYVMRGKELDIYLKGNGSCELFTEVDHINLHYRNKIRTISRTTTTNATSGFITTATSFGGSPLTLNGKSKKVTILNPKGGVNLRGKSFQTDTLIVQSDLTKEGFDSGSITMQCNKYLEAHLGYLLDVNYSGDPEVVTSAKDYGRVIKMKN